MMESRELFYYYTSTSSYPLDAESTFYVYNNQSANITLFGTSLTPRHSHEISIALITAYSLVFISGAVGNFMVICVIVNARRMRNVTNLFLLNLAIADLLVTFFCLPCTLLANIFLPWILGNGMCKTVAYVQGVSVCASVYSLVAVSFDRFLAIRYPLKPQWHLTKRKAKSLITLIWSFSLFLTLPWLFVFRTETILSTEYCLEIWPSEILGKLYFIVVNLILYYILPFGLITYFYSLIWLRVLKRNIPFSSSTTLNARGTPCPSESSCTTTSSGKAGTVSTSILVKGRARDHTKRKLSRRTSSSPPSSSAQICKLHRKTKISVLKMLTVVISIFLISWLPLYMIFTWFKFYADGEKLSVLEERFLSIATPLAQWLGSSNSCINPIIYNFLDKRFRKGFRDILCSSFAGRGRGDRSNNRNIHRNSNSIRSYNYNNRSFRSTFRS